MDSFTLEFSAHRIGGTDRYERSFVARNQSAYPSPTGYTSVLLQGGLFPTACIRIELNRFVLVRPALWSAGMSLADVSGRMVSAPRPVLFSVLPSDVAMYSSHICHESEEGVYSIGLRVPTMAWADVDLDTLKAQTD